MNKVIFSVFLFFCSTLHVIVYGQTRQIVIKVKNADTRKPVAGIVVNFGVDGSRRSDDYGLITKNDVPVSQSALDVEITSEDWILVSPTDNRLRLPVESNTIVEIVVRYTKRTEIANTINKIESELQKINANDSTLIKILYNVISQKSNLSPSELKSAAEKSKTREKKFNDISSLFSRYLLELKNLKRAFEHFTEQAIESNAALGKLDSAVVHYSVVYDQITTERNQHVSDIRVYWEDEALSDKTKDVIADIMGDIHAPYIKGDVTDIITKINDINSGVVKKRREKKGLKREIRKDLESLIDDLDDRIPGLQEDINVILEKLEKAK